jgi:hypothetical protein
MNPEKTLSSIISYLKVATGFGAVICLIMMFFVGFDPWHSLDKLIWSDLYGSTELPELARPAFTLAFLLFCWLSVLTMVLMFLITKYALSRKEKWGYWSLMLVGILWPLGGAVITYYTGAWSYFVSVAAMTVMFFPAVILLYPYFRNK